MANKVRFGFRNVHYAKITEGSNGEISYGSPVALPGGVNLTLDPEGDSSDFFADDSIYYSLSVNQGYSGTLELALVPEAFLTDIMGYTKDSNGALIENADDKYSPFALGFEIQGDEKGRRVWYYNCSVSRSSQNASTKEQNATPQTESLSIKAMPRLSDKAVKATLELNSTNQSAYNSFFESVYEKEQ